MEFQATFFSNQFRHVNKDCWHQRLGHPHQILEHLHSKKFISFNSHFKSFEVCTSCQMVKSCKLPFFPSTNNTSNPFYKIHCDLGDQHQSHLEKNFDIMQSLLMTSPTLHGFFQCETSLIYLFALINFTNMLAVICLHYDCYNTLWIPFCAQIYI